MSQLTVREPATSGRKHGFPDLPCLRCGEAGSVSVQLADLDGDEAFKCGSCDAEYGLAEVRETTRQWACLIAWVDLAPVFTETV